MAHLAISHDSCGATVVEAALRLLLISVCRRFRETGEPGAKGYAKYLEFLEIVERNYLKAMSIETYAKNLGVSSKTLSRHVREAASCSPSHVVAERIALEMKRLLVHSDLSVKEISAQLGMDDASYATRFFRKHCGLAPSGRYFCARGTRLTDSSTELTTPSSRPSGPTQNELLPTDHPQSR